MPGLLLTMPLSTNLRVNLLTERSEMLVPRARMIPLGHSPKKQSRQVPNSSPQRQGLLHRCWICSPAVPKPLQERWSGKIIGFLISQPSRQQRRQRVRAGIRRSGRRALPAKESPTWMSRLTQPPANGGSPGSATTSVLPFGR